MGFASLLAQMKRKGSVGGQNTTGPASSAKPGPMTKNTDKKPTTTRPPATTSSSSSKLAQVVPTYDPAVLRLKAARLLERDLLLKKKQDLKASAKTAAGLKKPAAKSSSTVKSTKSSNGPLLGKNGTSRRGGKPAIEDFEEESKPQRKKLSYKELMLQLKSVDGSNMLIKIKAKSASPEPQLNLKARTKKELEEEERDKLRRSISLKSSTTTTPIRQKKSFNSHSASPNGQSLKRKRSATSSRSKFEQYEEDLSDFVVSEDEEFDYHLDIQNLFGRNKQRRVYYDDYSDDDDMEATGADILQEESKSSRYARMEEERELELERQKKLEKMKRLKKVA